MSADVTSRRKYLVIKRYIGINKRNDEERKDNMPNTEKHEYCVQLCKNVT